MKKVILTTIFILCILQNGISQKEPREIKYIHYKSNWQGSDFRKKIETEKSYNTNDSVSSKISKVYNEDGTIQYWQGRFYEYDSNNLLKKFIAKRYNQDVNLWITQYWIDYQYNQNGCLINEQTTQNIGSQISRRITYTRNSDCQITYQLDEWLGNGFDLSIKDYITRDYHSDGISYDEKLYSNPLIGGDPYLKLDRKIIYGQNRKISEFYLTIFSSPDDTLYQVQNFYSYDEYDNLTTEKEYRIQESPDWQLHRQTFFENEYDENGFLVRMKTEVWYYDNSDYPNGILDYSKENFYQNSCEGIVEEYSTKEGNSGVEDRYEYGYEGINECLDIENLDFNLAISPNPSNDIFNITSPIFKTGNTEILVYSLNGNVLLQKNENSRCESTSLDLSFLPTGLYLLYLRCGTHFVKSKIIITK